ADGITVSSRFLQRRFGGLLLPHVRDTTAWKPGAADGAAARRRLGIGTERVVMFLGTPRGYKGVDDLADAMAHLARRDAVLAVIGADEAGSVGRRLRERYPSTRLLAGIPFDDVPQYLEAADVVAVPQRETTDTRGQVPAKLFDAMTLGRPIIATRVSMIPEILEGAGVLVAPGDVDALAGAIAQLLDHPEASRPPGPPPPHPAP